MCLLEYDTVRLRCLGEEKKETPHPWYSVGRQQNKRSCTNNLAELTSWVLGPVWEVCKERNLHRCISHGDKRRTVLYYCLPILVPTELVNLKNQDRRMCSGPVPKWTGAYSVVDTFPVNCKL